MPMWLSSSMRRVRVRAGRSDRATLGVCCRPIWAVGRQLARIGGVIAAVFGKPGTGGPGSWEGPMAGTAVVCGSGRNGEFGRRVMEGEDLVDVVHVAFAADRAEAVINALLGEVGVEIGNVGRFGIGQAEQLPAAN